MKKCATSVAAVGLGLFWLMACGGKSADDGKGAAGAQNSAGSSSAGATSSAGTTSSAGATGGGNCYLPKASGPCDAYEPSFWHNEGTGLCEPFVYGGCQGNANRFATRDECVAACGGGGENWGMCQFDSDCAVASAGCCEACEPVQGQQLLAVNQSHLNDLQDAQCIGGAACAPCPFPTQYEATRKYFKPVCHSGQCSLLDVRTSPLTQCKGDSDCFLRDGVNCCTGCDGSFVPANKSADFCNGMQTPCDACVSTGSEQYRTVCKDGACVFNPPLR